jgi:hypothetical protein
MLAMVWRAPHSRVLILRALVAPIFLGYRGRSAQESQF